MNRRAFLQSVIAVPLVAVGMPQSRAVDVGDRIERAMRFSRPIDDAELLERSWSLTEAQRICNEYESVWMDATIPDI